MSNPIFRKRFRRLGFLPLDSAEGDDEEAGANEEGFGAGDEEGMVSGGREGREDSAEDEREEDEEAGEAEDEAAVDRLRRLVALPLPEDGRLLFGGISDR